MVVTNHPLASAAAAECLLAGGNAIDAAVTALFALSVVEPMMVGPLGGGLAHIRLADGSHRVIDTLGTAPRKARPDMYEPVSTELAKRRDTKGRANEFGPLAVAVPGALAGWCLALDKYGTMPLAEAVAPAIRYAATGFRATSYLADCVSDMAPHLANDPTYAAIFLPGGAPLAAGTRVVRADMAASLRLIAEQGPAALYDGPLGHALVAYMEANGGLIDAQDLATYRPIERAPVVGTYRGYEIVGPPPPSSAGVHVTQMLNLLEPYDLAKMGFGSADATHLLAEVMRIAFADRAVATADPAFVDVPVARIISKDYAATRGRDLKLDRTQEWGPGLAAGESANTTHVTVADAFGNIVASTQTLNGVFGACVAVPGTGLAANDYMHNFDPHPGNALSIAPGKRVYTSMAPTIVKRDGKPVFALGLPGGLRIFPSAMQAIVNLIDHGMSAQEAVEAPRIWTEGGVLELEPGIAETVAEELARRGHRIQRVKRIAGGMGCVRFEQDGMLTGAACWRADGTPVAVSGGLARPGVRFTV
ncbi:MAG: gamma-glutamyltransferase [Telmatospirillum sp.]|nr:gamma-glutamyltransferase [Telmatospirillum sp.]